MGYNWFMKEALQKELKRVLGNTPPEITILKSNGERELFDREKLKRSLLHSGASEADALNVLEHLVPDLHDDMTTGEIYRHAFDYLAKLSRPVARRYSLRRAVMDLGPSGFPFEDFVAELLRAKGYECLTRQTVLGSCVPHEVDVVAYNDKELIMVEAKFHNELGVKSDLKVALYIKSRFDDLEGNLFNYGGKDRRVTDGWLVTNTKFSTTAIHYAECKGMKLIGWGYPEKGNLQDLIEETMSHPVTCLTSLSQTDKRILINAGLVLCSNIAKEPQKLKELFGQNFDTTPVLSEINEL